MAAPVLTNNARLERGAATEGRPYNCHNFIREIPPFRNLSNVERQKNVASPSVIYHNP